MRILIVGGTRFVGRHITEAVLAAGHDVTVLHRGTTGADLFPQATHLLADRNEDLGALRGMRWDATIDVSAYRPRQVDALADVLDGGAGHYVYVSTVSVYATPARPQYGEDSPLLRLPDGPIPDEVTLETYGPLKALCEERAAARFGPGILIVRPTYVVGPGDHTGRFTYWARRLARGGTVLAPGHADRPIQVIDARDQADFVVGALAGGLSGTFNTVCRSMPFGQLLDRIAAAVAPAGTTLTWVDPDFLLAAEESGASLPLWYAGDDDDAMVNTASPDAAARHGLRNRPVEETARDVLGDAAPTAYLTPEREAELLAQWHAR